MGIWEAFLPIHGNELSSNGKHNNYSSRFGVKLSFTTNIEKLYPNKKNCCYKIFHGRNLHR